MYKKRWIHRYFPWVEWLYDTWLLLGVKFHKAYFFTIKRLRFVSGSWPVLRISITLMQLWIRIRTPARHFDADTDPDPWLQINAQNLDRLIFHTFWLFISKLMRIRIWIQLITLMRIRIRILPFSLIRNATLSDLELFFPIRLRRVQKVLDPYASCTEKLLTGFEKLSFFSAFYLLCFVL
jgi:hypothetical protein